MLLLNLFKLLFLTPHDDNNTMYDLINGAQNGFVIKPHGLTGRHPATTLLTGFTGIIDTLLGKGVTNSATIFDRLKENGFQGGKTIVKEYIYAHKDLVPAKRQVVAPQ